MSNSNLKIRIRIPLLVFFFVSSIQTATYSQNLHWEDISVDSLLGLHIEAVGGRARLEKIRNHTVYGRVESSLRLDSIPPFLNRNDIVTISTGQFKWILQSPNLSFEEIHIHNPGRLSVYVGHPPPHKTWNNGVTVVSTNSLFKAFGNESNKAVLKKTYTASISDTGRRAKERIDSVLKKADSPYQIAKGENLNRFLENHLFNEVLKTNEQGYKMEVLPIALFDGRRVFRLQVGKKYSTEIWMIDCISHLLIGVMHCGTSVDDLRSITRYDDYRTLDGLALPFRITETYDNNLSITYVVDEHKLNDIIPQEIFNSPVHSKMNQQ